MNEIPEDMITDALVLVNHERGEIEYSIVRTGKFHVVPNLTFTIAPNVHGLVLEATPPPQSNTKQEAEE